VTPKSQRRDPKIVEVITEHTRNSKQAKVGVKLSWVAELRYLGIFLVKSRSFKCSLDAAKRDFYRAANSIFGKVGRIASEEVVIHLIRTKCVPILLYGLEALPPNKSQLASLDFVVNRFFMKLFKTTDMQVVIIYAH